MDELLGALLAEREDDAAWRRFERLADAEKRAVVLALKERVDARVRNEPRAAPAAAEAMLRAAHGMPELEPLALRARAMAAHFNQDRERALADYTRAIALYEAAGDELDAARVRRSLVDVHQMAGHSDLALACADAARAVFERLGERALLAQLEVNVGNVYTRLDEYARARTCYKSALERFHALDDGLGAAFAQFNLAIVEINANRLGEAEAAFAAARERFARAGLGVPVADCDYHQAWLESRRGRFEAAVAGLERARQVYLANGKPSGPPLCDLDLAEIHLRLDARRDALALALRGLARFEELGLAYEAARCRALCGLARARLGEHASALCDLDAAAAAFRALGNDAAAAALVIQRCALEVDGGRARGCLRELELARDELRARQHGFLTDLASVVLARAWLALGEPARVLPLLEPLCAEGVERPLELVLQTSALHTLARAREALGERPAALALLRRAVARAEESYAEVPGHDLRVAFFRERHAAFVDLAFLLCEQGGEGAGPAFVLLERTRLRSLGESAIRGRADDPELRQAREHLDWLVARRLDAELGPSRGEHELRRLPPLDAELAAAERRVRALAGRARSGSLSRRGGVRHDELDLETLARARGADDVVVAYCVGARGARAFLLDERGVKSVRLDAGEAELRALRDRLLLHVDKLRLGRDYVETHERALVAALEPLLDELGLRLLEPLVDDIAGRALVVVPWGDLHDLPFHAFRVRGRALIETSEVSYGLSTALVARCRTLVRASGGRVLVTGLEHPSLPDVPRECETLARLYGARARVLAPDELVRVLRSESQGGGILHVAAHGVFQAKNPLFSALWLGETSLFAHDLLDMQLDLKLVTLSGCETGRKRRVAGEELYGLSRALFGAGVESTLGSLWAVEDRHACAFMSAFYAGLAAGSSARRAVALAQRALLVEHPHAAAWAAFALVGNPDVRFPAGPTP